MVIMEDADFKGLKDEVSALKRCLSEVVFERDELKYHICKQIEARYMVELGALETKLYDLYCRYYRLRRKRDLIQSFSNRKETVDLLSIEGTLDEEFEKYRKELEDRMRATKEALDFWECGVLSEAETQSVKAAYKALVKRLHPDLNPDQSEAMKALFLKATHAYEMGDLQALETIAILVDLEEEVAEELSSFEALEEDVARLRGLVKTVEAEIDYIYSTTPYTWRELLEDEEKLTDRRQEIEKQIAAYALAIETQEEAIRALLEERQ